MNIDRLRDIANKFDTLDRAKRRADTIERNRRSIQQWKHNFTKTIFERQNK